eukprot:3885796-Pleurochrysis_carterae.AAC.1
MSSEEPEQHPRYNRFGAYGAYRLSSASRIWDDHESKACENRNRTKRPTHREYAKALLEPAAIRAIIVGRHTCRNQWCRDGAK